MKRYNYLEYKCKLCGAEKIENKHKHFFDRHQKLATELWMEVYEKIAEPNMHGGSIKPVEGMAPGIYEPDDEMYAAFERGSNMGLAHLDKLVSEYFIEEEEEEEKK